MEGAATRPVGLSAANRTQVGPAGGALAPADVGAWMFEASADCVQLLDAEGRVLRMNLNGQWLMEIEDMQAVRGSSWASRWPEPWRAVATSSLVAAAQGEVGRFQAPCATAKGTPKWWDVSVTAVSQRGAVTHLLAVARDVTAQVQASEEAKLAREAAEEAAQAKARYAANLGHELRTPLNAVVGLAQVLGKTSLDAQQRGYLEKMQSSVQHLLGLFDEVFDMARAESGKLQLNERDFKLEDVLQRARNIMAETLGAKGLALKYAVAASVPQALIGDAARICQVLLSYVGHAARLAHEGSVEVQVRVLDRDGDAVRLQFDVMDGGRGLTEAERAALFHDFSQSAPERRQQRGAGLGLALAKRLAGLMGGEVGVEAQPAGGNRCWFTLRVREGRRDGAEVAIFAEPPAVLAGKRVLVVEDDLMTAHVAQQLLELAGMRVKLAANGKAAIEMLAQHAFDAVLMDMLMPVMGGLEAAQRIREQPALAALPIIATTANARDKDKADCADAGMNDFISKPVDPAKLWGTLAHWVQAGQRQSGRAAPGDEFYQVTMPAPLV